MENKVLVKIIVPEFDSEFDVFIPVNELIWKIKKICIKSISDITSINLDIDGDYILLNKDLNRIYNNNEVVLNTDIRNSTELIILSK